MRLLNPYRLTLALLLALPFTAIAQTLYLGNTITVADGGQYDNVRPRVILDRAGDPVVVWASTIGGRKAFAANWSGTAFNTPIRINPSGTVAAYDVEGPNAAAHGDTLHIVYSALPMTSGRCMIRTSTDGGDTWRTPVEVDSLATDMSAFPNVTTDAQGNPIVLYMRHNSDHSNPRYVIRRSTDLGQTWLPEVNATTPAFGAEVCDCCTGTLLPPQGSDLLALFRENANNLRDMWATRSTDGGQSFTQGIDLDSTDWVLPACPSSGPVGMLQGDTLRTAFMSAGGDGNGRVYFGLAHIDSAQAWWNAALPGMSPGETQDYPALAGLADTFAIAYLQAGIGSPSIRLAWSTTGSAGILAQPGANVSSPDPNPDVPDLAYRDGVFHIVWASQSTGDILYRQAAFHPLVAVEAPSSPQMRIHPHPVLHGATLRFGQTLPPGTHLRCLDAQGRVLREEMLPACAEWPFERGDLPSGMYFLQIQHPGQTPASLKLLLH